MKYEISWSSGFSEIIDFLKVLNSYPSGTLRSKDEKRPRAQKVWKNLTNKRNHKITKLVILRGINLANYRSNIRKRKAGTGSSVPATQEVTRVRTPRKENHEVLATVGSLLGSKRVTLQCMDGIVRMGRIPGSKNKKMWIHEGDVVIVAPWEIQDSKADVIWKYTRPQVEWLERKGYLK